MKSSVCSGPFQTEIKPVLKVNRYVSVGPLSSPVGGERGEMRKIIKEES